jgi:hypothetical protein
MDGILVEPVKFYAGQSLVIASCNSLGTGHWAEFA